MRRNLALKPSKDPKRIQKLTKRILDFRRKEAIGVDFRGEMWYNIEYIKEVLKKDILNIL